MSRSRRLARVARALEPGALLADTLSVKTAIVAALEDEAPHLEALSLNPMFAPSLGIDGRAVAAVVVHDGPRARELLELLRSRGAHVVEVSAREHDELTAVTQALTHAAVLAFGLALEELDVDVDALGELAPPPHLTLLAMLARIASGQPATYRDVQAANPHARRVRAPRWRAACAAWRMSSRAATKRGFDALLAQLEARLGRDAEPLRASSARTSSQAARPPAGARSPTPLAANTQPKGPTA